MTPLPLTLIFANREIDQTPAGARFRDSLLAVVASRHTLRQILEGFAEVLGQAVRFDHCALYRLRPDGTSTKVHALARHHSGGPAGSKTVSLPAQFQRILAEGLPYSVPDLMDRSVALSFPDLLGESARSALFLPLEFRGQVLGFLLLASHRIAAFTETNLPPARAAAQLLAMVMAHEDLAEDLQELAARRTTELEETLKDTEMLLEVGHILLRGEAPPATFQRLAEVLKERTGYGCCDILLWDPESSELVLEVATGTQVPPAVPRRISLGRGIVGTAAAERVPIRVPNVERDPRYVPLYPETRSEMAVPLLAGERLLGVINMESPHPGAFSERDLEVAGNVARQVSLWLENRLLDAQRDKAEREARASALELALANADLKKAMEQLRASRAQLVQAEKLASLGTLVAGAAHELNNPLTVMQGYAELLLEQPLPAGLRERLEMIRQQASRAGVVVEGLLGLARCQAPSSAAREREPFPLAEAVEGALAMRAEDLSKQNIRLRQSLDRETLVRADRDEVQQVVLNLILNAEHAVREAARKEISLELARAGGRAELRVADTGPGITEEALPRIFDPFFTTKPVGCGAGLGLSVCYGIVTAYGGTIQAANRPEGGAIFTVVLPCA